jgi:hypothetical protein
MNFPTDNDGFCGFDNNDQQCCPSPTPVCINGTDICKNCAAVLGPSLEFAAQNSGFVDGSVPVSEFAPESSLCTMRSFPRSRHRGKPYIKGVSNKEMSMVKDIKATEKKVHGICV